jgi:hypothetical protein
MDKPRINPSICLASYLILLVRRSSGVAGVQELQNVRNFVFSIFANLHWAQTVSREFAGARLPPPVTPELLNSFPEEVSEMTLNTYQSEALRFKLFD